MKGSNQINWVVAFLVTLIAAAVILAIVPPLIYGAGESASACRGPFKAVAAVLADMTGVSMC